MKEHRKAVRAYCANSLIDRGWGKPNQAVGDPEVVAYC
jgi:hypothetical protein